MTRGGNTHNTAVNLHRQQDCPCGNLIEHCGNIPGKTSNIEKNALAKDSVLLISSLLTSLYILPVKLDVDEDQLAEGAVRGEPIEIV